MTDTTIPTLLSRDSGEPLADQIVRAVSARIDDRQLRVGSRMPSIRRFAAAHGVSPFTVVASYDRLVAQGYLESRRGAGFFVRDRSPHGAALRRDDPDIAGAPQQRTLDVVWLIRHMFRQSPTQPSSAAGVLPTAWLDGPGVANALRAVSRQNVAGLLNYGAPQGYAPLRDLLQRKLAELEIAAVPDQFVTTLGVTQAIDLVAREFCRPGDTVFVDDPAWFLMFGSFAAMGLKVVGIRRLADGPTSRNWRRWRRCTSRACTSSIRCCTTPVPRRCRPRRRSRSCASPSVTTSRCSRTTSIATCTPAARRVQRGWRRSTSCSG